MAERVPAGDHGLRVGDRVFGMARTHGSYAEYTAVAPAARMEPLARIPEGVADDQAAALPIPAVTALRTIELLEVTAGQHVVVMGATGGVGGYAVQMARSRGAHVIATVRGDDVGRLASWAPKRSTTARRLTSSMRCTPLTPTASILNSEVKDLDFPNGRVASRFSVLEDHGDGRDGECPLEPGVEPGEVFAGLDQLALSTGGLQTAGLEGEEDILGSRPCRT